MTDPIVARWADAERILDDVLDLPPETRRTQARAQCGEDIELASAVMRLLDADESSVVRSPASLVRAAMDDDARASVPAAIGPFRVLAEVGHGGMGRVFRAVRAGLDGAPEVAVKVLDRHVDAGMRHRFEREQQTLAKLVHPRIARLQDGGVTDSGAPYLVMEFVDGVPIDDYARTHGLDVEGCLSLVAQVCRAVEFAHGQLVVHRDLKPANVLVDRHGQVKLLDFGIAKWLDELDAESPLTLTSQRVLTPSHAAPEQFLGEPVTVATDVYQLGLLLYTVLTGRRAHGAAGTSSADVRRAVCDIDPVRPSLAAADAAGVPHVRAMARRLSGDLDAIVLKALRKDPRDRYASVEALRRDLDDHLAHRPVAARRGGTVYAVRKYARRHRTALVAATGVVLAGTAGIVGMVLQARVTAAERDRAVGAEAAASAVSGFLVNELLTAATPERSQGRPLSVADVLANASRSVEFSLKDSPRVQAEVRQTLARSYLALGQYAPAATHAREARRLVGAAADATDRAVLTSRRLLVDIALASGSGATVKDEARRLVGSSRHALGVGDSDTLLAEATYGRVLEGLDELADAEGVLRAADTTAGTTVGVSAEARFAVRTALIDVLNANGKAVAAEPLVRDQIERLRQHYGPTHPQLATAARQLASALTEQLEYEGAVTASEEQVRLHEQLYGADHPATAKAIHELAVAYDRATRDSQATATAARAYQLRQRVLGADHPDTLSSLRNLAISTRRAGNAAEALPMYRTVADSTARRLGTLHPRAISALDEVGSPLLDLGRASEARQVRQSVASSYERALAAGHDDTEVLVAYANFLIDAEPADLRNPTRAVALAERAVAATNRERFGYVRTLARAYRAAGQPHQALATAMEASALPAGIQSFVTETMVVQLMSELDPPRVERWLLDRLDRLRRERGPDEYLQVRTLEHLASYYLKAGRPADAEARIREQLEVLARSVPPTHFMVASAKGDLGERLLERGAVAEAEPLLLASFDGHMASRRFTSRGRERARDRMVRLYETLHRPAEAKKYRDYVLPTFSER